MSSKANKHDDAVERKELPSARIKQGHLSRLLWLVPLGAVCLCGWFVYRDFVSTGPKITLYFENADGVEEKNTQLKYRGATVGEVTAIALTPDSRRVKVRAQLTASARNLAREGSMFWIVRPELKVGSVSGLRTIISGEYIAVQPGKGAPTNSFLGAEQEPITEKPNALAINLIVTNLGSIQQQTPVIYRGVQVGEVQYYQLGADACEVIIHASIWEEYAPLVRPETRFWNAGGLSVRAGLFKGVQVSAESPRMLISGGIEFATPPDPGMPATNGTTFVLNDKAEEKWKTWAPKISLHLPPPSNQVNQTNEMPNLNLEHAKL